MSTSSTNIGVRFERPKLAPMIASKRKKRTDIPKFNGRTVSSGSNAMTGPSNAMTALKVIGLALGVFCVAFVLARVGKASKGLSVAMAGAAAAGTVGTYAAVKHFGKKKAEPKQAPEPETHSKEDIDKYLEALRKVPTESTK